ncbi:MAG: hypothetical protein ACXU8A_00070 [Burkholderiaceae bacterium]
MSEQLRDKVFAEAYELLKGGFIGSDEFFDMAWNAALSAPSTEGKPEKIAPVQGYAAGIPWSMHLEAYDVYCKKYGKQEALITDWCRGGFGVTELDMFIPGWRDRVSEIGKLKAEVVRLNALLTTPPTQALAEPQELSDEDFPSLPKSSHDGDRTVDYFGHPYEYTARDMYHYARAAIRYLSAATPPKSQS